MKNTLTYLIIFLFLSINVKADDVIEGRAYEGTLFNVFSSSFNFTLPPGKWTIKDISKKNTWYTLYLLNYKDDGRLYIQFPETVSASDGYIGGGLKKCKNETKNDRSLKVIADGIQRGSIQSKYCFLETTWIPSNEKEFTIEIEVEKSGGSPIYQLGYYLYYPIGKSNTSALSKSELKRIGNILRTGLIGNSMRKNADFSDINMLIKTISNQPLSTTSLSTNSNVNKLEGASDGFVCRKSTSLDGMSWENIDSKFGDYVAEVFRRNLSLKECRQLTGRKPSDVNKNTKPIDSTDIKIKLKELKTMLNDELINQDQYDAKSTELLKDF